MNQDVSYWLNEVKTLQAQVAMLQEERDHAYRDALNWRQRYETEAQQRRQELRHSQEELIRLRADLAQLQGRGLLEESDQELAATQAEVLELTDVAQLQQRLQAVLQERQQLLQALQTERKAHNQTRESLTVALGDAVDQLAQYKKAGSTASPERAPTQGAEASSPGSQSQSSPSSSMS
ncbi:MAG: hypothetical protein ACO4CG_05145 [Prochlorothrix sp.]|nr:hypothetical protein [Prochlorothrix sp.]